MPHRDDHEAARLRIVSLERELEDTRRRAETAERAARIAQTAPKPQPTPKKAQRAEKKKKKHRAPQPVAPAFDPRWPPGGLERYQKLAGGTAALVYAPAAFLFITGTFEDEPSFAALGIGTLAQLVITYFVGRRCGAPSPANGALVLMLVSALIGFGLFFGATDMLWSSVISAGIGQTILRAISGLAALAIGAIISGAWSAEAASSDVGSD